MVNFLKNIAKKYKSWREIRMIRNGMKECERRKFTTGKMQFLIKLNDGKLAVVDRTYTKVFNDTFKSKKPMSYLDLCQLAIYKTN